MVTVDLMGVILIGLGLFGLGVAVGMVATYRYWLYYHS